MADSDRTPPHLVELLERIEREPDVFDFYQAVRLLDCADLEKPPTGRSDRAEDDVVRFGQEASMRFAPATLSVCAPPSGRRPRRLLQRFLGLLGPNGPLPIHLTEFTLDRVRDRKDPTLLRFLDVFHHRMVSFFYRAWSGCRPTVSFEQPKWDRFSAYVDSFFGIGMASLRDRDALPDLPKRHFAGLLSCQTRHAEGLLALLTEYFRVPVQIDEFVGQWVELPAGSQCLLGQSPSHLGESVTIGSHVWDCQQMFRITLGPLTFEQYQRMLPDDDPTHAAAHGHGLESLVATVRTYVGDELDWDLQLVLRKDETPPVSLGEQGQLGWTAWLAPDEVPRDPDHLVMRPMERVFERPRRA